MEISVALLKRKKACSDQVKLFERTFGKSAKITLANCIKAGEVGLDFDWAAENLLSSTALADYEKAKATARDAYKKARATAWDAHLKATAPAWDAYKKAKATAFYEAWKKDQEK